MTKTKASSKKQQKRGVDFKKIKRKVGRKLPPPKNATNIEIKSKAIVLPEQSVAAEKEGLAVSKKGLTLKELLQDTSHNNAKARRDALMGMRDLFVKYPEDLKLHKVAVIGKLCERINDDDKMVRENLYQIFKSVILPGCKEDNQRPFISLMMPYIFYAMTHLSIDVRLMAFKFVDLVVRYHPPSFFLYAEKILQNYGDSLRRDGLYLQQEGKLQNALAGLVRCLSLLPSNKTEVNLSEKNVPEQKVLHAYEPDNPAESAEFSIIINRKLKDLLPVLLTHFQYFIPLIHGVRLLDVQSFDCTLGILQSIDLVVRFFSVCGRHESSMWDQSLSSVLLKKLLVGFPLNPTHQPSEKDDDRYFRLNIRITEIFLHSSEWICPPVYLLEKFLAFIESALLGKICNDTWCGKAAQEEHISRLVPFIPKLVSQVMGCWKSRLLQAFSQGFRDCNPESSLKLAFLAAISEILLNESSNPLHQMRKDYLHGDVIDAELLDHQITWITELPRLLILLGDKHPSTSQVLLNLLLGLGRLALMDSILAFENDNLQDSLQEFYSTFPEGHICYGPFIRLSRDSQLLAVSGLRFFYQLNKPLLKSITSCCLSHELDESVLLKIIDHIQTGYEERGFISRTDYISFLITLVCCCKVFPENVGPATESDPKISNRGTFKLVTEKVCSCLSGMGDNSVILESIEGKTLEQISLKAPLDNTCAMLRMLVELDFDPTRLSEQSIISLSKVLSGYLIDVMHCVPEDGIEPAASIQMQQHYYTAPCFCLFDRRCELLNLVLNMMGSLITDSSLSLSSSDHIRYANGQSSRIKAIVSMLQVMNRNDRMRQILSSSMTKIDQISQNICSLQSSNKINLTIDERQKIRCAFDRLKILTSSLPQEMRTT